MGYKLFYIANGKILFKRKYSALQIEDLEAFLLQAEKANLNYSKVNDEKRDLDFQDILYSQLQDTASKEILYLKKKNNLTGFLDRLGAL
jgi:excinuclease ABC subunit C